VPLGALKALALYEDSRPRVVKATKEWNWRPLVSVLEHEDVIPPSSCPTSLSVPCLFAFLHFLLFELPCSLSPLAMSEACTCCQWSALTRNRTFAVIQMLPAALTGLAHAFRAFRDTLQMLQDLPQCGTNLAATDGVMMVQALIASEPAPDAVITAASKAAAAAVVTRFLEAGGMPALLQVEC